MQPIVGTVSSSGHLSGVGGLEGTLRGAASTRDAGSDRITTVIVPSENVTTPVSHLAEFGDEIISEGYEGDAHMTETRFEKPLRDSTRVLGVDNL